METLVIPGGGVDEHKAHQAGNEAQRQQEHVAFFEKFFDHPHWLENAPSLPGDTV
jgi:hypothetical protein